jgi:hypothetical protein
LGPQESELNDERSNRRKNGTKMGRSLSGSKMSSERGLSSDDRDREDAPKIMERRTLEEDETPVDPHGQVQQKDL